MFNKLFLMIFCVTYSLFVTANDQGMDCLVMAYPDFLSKTQDSNVLKWRDGTALVYDDGVVKNNFESLLSEANLKDQMSMPYPQGWSVQPPDFNSDPGRIRYEPLFEKMYGNSEGAVRKNLTKVFWAPAQQMVTFTRINGADQALEKIGQLIVTQYPDLIPYVKRSIGTFYWRNIQGTDRKSAHSFGIAIDFKLPNHLYKYWLWSGCKAGYACRFPSGILQDQIMQQLVDLFEINGFIWGGKWYHYDTMHFEYRPELVNTPCTLKN